MIKKRADKYMNREEMIAFIQANPGIKVTHLLFSENEYLYAEDNGNVYDENGYLFEDWVSEGPGQHNGIRMRAGGNWENGWGCFI